MKTYILPLLAALILCVAGCTQNQRARGFGGTMEYDLAAGEKLVNVTWEQEDLWLNTRPMLPTDTAVTYTMHEKSSFGAMQGTIIIREHKE